MDVSSMLALTLFSWPPVSQSSPPSHRHKLYLFVGGVVLNSPSLVPQGSWKPISEANYAINAEPIGVPLHHNVSVQTSD